MQFFFIFAFCVVAQASGQLMRTENRAPVATASSNHKDHLMRSERENFQPPAAPVHHETLMRREVPKPVDAPVHHETLMRREAPQPVVAPVHHETLMRREAPRPVAPVVPQSGRLMRDARPGAIVPTPTNDTTATSQVNPKPIILTSAAFAEASSAFAQISKGFKGHNIFLVFAAAGMLFSLFGMAQRAMKRTTSALKGELEKEGKEGLEVTQSGSNDPLLKFFSFLFEKPKKVN